MQRIARWFRALVSGATIDHELDEEMRLHIEMEAEDLVRTRGLDPEEARRQAAIAFGGLERHKEAHRDARGVRWVEGFTQDVRYAARSLRRNPGFSLAAVLVLALGIGATTAVFSAVDAVLIDPGARDVVVIYEQNSPTNRWTLSTVDYRAVEAQSQSFTAVGAVRHREVSLFAGGDAKRVVTGFATAGFFRALNASIVRGRGFDRSDERVGAAPVVLVGQAFAQRELGGEASALGRSLVIDGISHTVVGILSPNAKELAGIRAQVWPVLQLAQPTRRGPFGLRVVGRLKPGVTLEEARRDLRQVSDAIFPIWQAGFQDSTAKLTPVPQREAIIGGAGRMLGIFSGAVGLVLLIAVANVAGLMLVRISRRWREISLRTVLGATRARVVRLLVTESVVLAAVGGGLGIGFGVLGVRLFAAIGPRMPRIGEAHLDARAALFAAAVTLFSGIVVGILPVVLLQGREAARGLNEGARTVGGSRRTRTLRAAFVVAEFALALPLLAAAGLLMNSFLRLQRVDPGFDPRPVLAINVELPSGTYPNDSAIAKYWAIALPRVRNVPGVIEASLGTDLPPDNDGNSNNFDLVDHPVGAGNAEPTSPWPSVSGEFFATLRVPLLEGRTFTVGDSADAPPVLVVSRSWARHYFPEGSVIGRRLVSGGCYQCPLTTIVGVVGDVKYMGLDGASDAAYEPVTQASFRGAYVFVRTDRPAAQMIGPVREALRSVDPGVPLDDAAPMEERLYDAITQPRHWVMLLSGFAAAALALAAVGIFGLLTYTVNARRREIGVRMALGEQQSSVVAMVVRRGMGHAVAGAAIGLAAALVAGRWLASALFDVSPADPATLLVVTAILLGVAFLACWLPARRAASIDAAEALRLD